MTRKDYQLIATELRYVWEESENKGTIQFAANRLCAALAQSYSNFDGAKFLEAAIGQKKEEKP